MNLLIVYKLPKTHNLDKYSHKNHSNNTKYISMKYINLNKSCLQFTDHVTRKHVWILYKYMQACS